MEKGHLSPVPLQSSSENGPTVLESDEREIAHQRFVILLTKMGLGLISVHCLYNVSKTTSYHWTVPTRMQNTGSNHSSCLYDT